MPDSHQAQRSLSQGSAVKQSDNADALFRWEELDQRLLSPKTNDLAEEMHKRALEAESRISFDTARSGNSAGYLSQWLDFQEQLTDEWAERLDAAYCETWRQQNHSNSAAFIRAVRGRAIADLIAARKSSVRSGVLMRAQRMGEAPNSIALDQWSRRIDRLSTRWNSNLEAEAAANEYKAAPRSENVSLERQCVFNQHENFQAAIRKKKARVQEIDLIVNTAPPMGSSRSSRLRLIEEKLYLEQAIAELEAEDSRLLAQKAVAIQRDRMTLPNVSPSSSKARPGRTPRLHRDFVDFAGKLWLEATRADNAKVLYSQLEEIASNLDTKDYLPPADYLEGSFASELRSFNSHHSNAKQGTIKT